MNVCLSLNWNGSTRVCWSLACGPPTPHLCPFPFQVNFVWNHQKIDRSETKGGQFGSLVEMFGWPYQDIASECSMLGKAGYMGVKVFPPSESILSDRWLQNGERNPWFVGGGVSIFVSQSKGGVLYPLTTANACMMDCRFWVYQPVSYRLASRMGSLEDLKAMIKECRSHGVRVYADAVNNHMTGGGNDVGLHRNGDGGGCVYWGPKVGVFSISLCGVLVHMCSFFRGPGSNPLCASSRFGGVVSSMCVCMILLL